MEITIWTWIAFNTFLLGMLALSLGASHRSARVAGWRQVRDRRLETMTELLVE